MPGPLSRALWLAALTTLQLPGDPGSGQVTAMIEPRLDRPRWWVAPARPAEDKTAPVVPRPPHHDQPLPPYIVSSNIVGPKPPPGYSFSAGPKPARFPKQQDKQAAQHSPAKQLPATQSSARNPFGSSLSPKQPLNVPPTRPEVSRSENDLKHLWKSRARRPVGPNARSGGRSRPSDITVCGPLCPPYRLAARSARYEVRLYPRTLWASYVTVTENRLLAEMEAQAGLAEFLNGKNSHGIVLPQTFPYVTQLRYGRVPGLQKQDSDFSVSVPLLEGVIHPRPDSNQLVVDSVSKQRVFVTSFWARPWKLTDKTLRLRAKRFIRRLRRHGHSFLHNYFYLAKYDSSESRRRSFYELWLYSTPYKSKRRFRPTGKPEMSRPTNQTLDTLRRLCRGLECPQFEVLDEYRGGIQKRHYYNAVFATSKMDGCDSSIDAMWRGLLPLHLYRHGINSHLEVIEATRPIGVLRVHQTVSAHNSSCDMTSLMYLPKRLHQNPPNTGPSAPPTSLAYVHQLHVLVRTVGGFVLEPGRAAAEVASFRRELDALGLCYQPGTFYVAVYDFIQRYHGRLNEIWLVAQRCAG